MKQKDPEIKIDGSGNTTVDGMNISRSDWGKMSKEVGKNRIQIVYREQIRMYIPIEMWVEVDASLVDTSTHPAQVRAAELTLALKELALRARKMLALK
jgi:hypothetical protein